MPGSSTPDLCVIGGGTAGHALALAAAAMGARCAVVDPRARLGGGQAADLAEAMLLEAAGLRRGARAPAFPFDLAAFRLRLGRTLADLAPNHAAERLRTVGARVVQARPAFADARTVMAGAEAIRARRFVLATGGETTLPDWAVGLDTDRLLRPATLALRATLPDRVTVVAETPEGFVWAQALRRLGATVTLVAAPGAGAPFDREILTPVLAALRREGVVLRLDSKVDACERIEGGVRLHLGPTGATVVEASHLMILRTAVPALGGLALDRAGVACMRGAPVVDEGLRTGNGRIFAIGDVLGRHTPGGAAVPHQIGLVLRAVLFRQRVRYRPARVPITLATEPPLAQVGVLEPDASAAPRRVLRWPVAETLRGRASDDATGGVKVVATPAGRVLGAAMVGPAAETAIVSWALAIARNIPAGALASLPVPDAALAEASRRAGVNLLAARLSVPWVRRMLALVRALP